MKKYQGNCWPNKTQMLLLNAALCEPTIAINAWNQWVSQVDIDKVDPFSYQIMPKIYKNLLNADMHFEHHGLLKGIYKHTWMHNQLLFGVFIQSIQRWSLFPTQHVLLMKGAAMIAAYYQDWGVRVIGDIDILVPPRDMVSLMKHLLDDGFEATDPLSIQQPLQTEWTSPRHAISFKSKNTADSFLIDVHTTPLLEIPSCHQGVENWFEQASSVMWNGVQLYRLNATDLLFQTCIHGAKYSKVPLFRWIMDAATLLECAHAEIDWDAIVYKSRQYELVSPMNSALNYLHDYFNANIPGHVLSTLHSLPISTLDQQDFHYKSKKKGRFLHVLVSLWSRSRRENKTMIGYLKAFFELESAVHLPKILLVKTIRYFKKQ